MPGNPGAFRKFETKSRMMVMAHENQKRLVVLGVAAGLDDELAAWLRAQADELGAEPSVIAVAVLRDYMRASEALKAEQTAILKLH